MNFSVSAVIPNFNGRKLLEENLPSVISALKHSCTDYEIIISDDASTDDSLLFIKEKYPEIIAVKGLQNRGFSVAANTGIQKAGKRLVLLLNSDVKLTENYLTNQFRFFEKTDTFGVMGGIFSPDGKLIDAAKFPKWSGCQVKSTINFSITDPPAGFPIPTYFLSGANALMDREKLKELNGFNEIYSPFYMEDVDLSVRAWRMGWKCYYEPGALCFHQVSHTIGKHNRDKKIKRISARNKFIFHEFHLGRTKKLLWDFKMTGNVLLRWMVVDSGFYRAFLDYRKMRLRVLLSKEDFRKLNPVKSTEQVVDEIRESIRLFEKKLF